MSSCQGLLLLQEAATMLHLPAVLPQKKKQWVQRMPGMCARPPKESCCLAALQQRLQLLQQQQTAMQQQSHQQQYVGLVGGGSRT